MIFINLKSEFKNLLIDLLNGLIEIIEMYQKKHFI